MTKYLFTGGYTTQGVQGLLDDSATQRVAEVRKLVEAVGGDLESMYFTFGRDDFHIIASVPDNASAAAAASVAAASGAITVQTTVAMTAEELDDGLSKGRPIAAAFRAPGD